MAPETSSIRKLGARNLLLTVALVSSLMACQNGLNDFIPLPSYETEDPTSDSLRIANLTADHQVILHFHSQGCFHVTEYEFHFIGSDPGAVQIFEHPSESLFENSHQPRQYLGRIRLSNQELTQLDNLLEFYRLRKEGACTTEDRIEMSWLLDGKEQHRESYIDDTCQVDDDPNLLPLHNLIQKLASK